MTIKNLLLALTLIVLSACAQNQPQKTVQAPFVWDNANVYFLLTDRFNNGDTTNDVNFERNGETGLLRGFMGGDFRGIIDKINQGYFTDLGVNALWFSPVVEQIHGSVDESTGNTYGFHGYWAKDWTRIDPNWGTEQDFMDLVDAAHTKGIRIVMDVVLNHTGPVTPKDPVYGKDWVRTGPPCTYESYESTVTCTLVENLPDIKTESNEEVGLPEVLLEKWKKEGRLEKEMEELNAFFAETAYPRAPRFYIIKWLTDFVRKYGVDGYRIDTAKHTEESVWSELYKQASKAFEEWKAANPDKVLDNNAFYTVGEVYGYGASSGRIFDNGGVQVDYFDHGMHALINFELKSDAQKDYEFIFAKYSDILNKELKGKSVLNYLSSHDDSHSFDMTREKAYKAANVLLLCPGASQIYYGDEINRPLIIEGTVGDATLRSFMNWEDIASNTMVNGVGANDLLNHYQKLGQFRAANPAVGAGVHTQITAQPYVFKREFTQNGYSNKVVVGMDLPLGAKTISVGDVFENGTRLKDHYSGIAVKVKNGEVRLQSDFDMALLAADK
ncbi:alpha-amylase [Saccharicrinis carchari]|uniref:Alpha-amylase n=1 Tax=Saccharicrinis carchari TaxID=1168039 RepID=A0A521D1A8_SACCC|nr:alpha-amylase family glycosyl hydrolase [Saccharicrinis carchari]SMO65442.1 alpha-amylase [Saccharicrinis carchari]